MKIKITSIVLHFLLILFLCLSSTSLTEKDAHDAYHIANNASNNAKLAWAKADTETDKAEAKYGISNDSVDVMQSALDLKESEVSSKKSGIIDSASSVLKAAGADPVDVVTDVTAIVLKFLKNNWNYKDLVKEKDNIESALSSQRSINADLKSKWDSKTLISDSLLAEWERLQIEENKALNAWIASKQPLTYSISAPSICFEGDFTECTFSINRAYEYVNWYLKSPGETGQGTILKTDTDVPDDYPKVLNGGFTVPSESGNFWETYVITAEAKVDDEVVSDSASVTLVKEGIFYNKKTFIEGKDETLDLTIIYKDLYFAELWIRGNLVFDTTYANGTHTVNLSEVIDSSYGVGSHSLMVKGYIGQRLFTGYHSITVVAPEGYFDNSTSISTYGTYEAKVSYNDPLRKVLWYFKKPDGEWEEVKSDDVNGGNTSSWSYSFSSKTGTYKVRAKVYFQGSSREEVHTHDIYVQ